MSGTSGDGVDASIIKSDGVKEYEVIKDKYFEYNSDIYRDIHNLKEKIHKIDHLQKYKNEINDVERKITIFHAEIIKELNISDDTLVGFHGQTIYHNAVEKTSRQLGNGELLNQLTHKNIVFNFRSNDIMNGGQGAPLTPIFHHLISKQNKIKLPVCFLNIGGISNITIVKDDDNLTELASKDIGPGNCLIDSWVRRNSDQKFDKDGKLATSGSTNKIILEQAQELYMSIYHKKKLSFDTNDFDVSFIRGLNLQDGASTLTDFTGSSLPEKKIDGESLVPLLTKMASESPHENFFFYYRTNELHAVRHKKWKFYVPHTYRSLNGKVGTNDGYPIPYDMNKIETPALFNLETDPEENRDVASENPELVAKISKIADSIRQVLGDRLTGVKGSEVRPVGRIEN